MTKKKILIVEDDPNILLGLEEVLKSDGFDVAICNRGDEAESAVLKEKPSLIVLDVMLPGKNGYEICRDIRAAKSDVPILMLSAKGQEMDKVIGLDTGADDYVTKPFGLRELLSRINALIRRSTDGGHSESESTASFEIGKTKIDPAKFELSANGKTQPLTEKELKLLQLFHRHAGEALSRDRLLNEVWGYNYHGTTRTLDQVIVQLRKKLGDNAGNPQRILTVHGVGYKLAN